MINPLYSPMQAFSYQKIIWHVHYI